MPELIDPDSVAPVHVGPGCIRRDLPTCGGLRAWIVEMEPGAQWPHVDQHGAFGEQVLVLSGEMIEGDRVCRAGSYVCFEPFSTHQPRTATGVKLFGVNVADREVA